MAKPRKRIKGHKKACGNKQRFNSEETARKAAYRPGRREFMMPYKCKKCGFWHYGHPSAKQLLRSKP